MARRRRGGIAHEEDAGHANVERWLLSYADMITLLMALFIVLYAMSQVDQSKFEKFSEGLAEYFGEPAVVTASDGILEGGKQPLERSASTVSAERLAAAQAVAAREAAVRQREELAAIRDRIHGALAAKGLAGAVQFQIRDDGLVVNIVTERVLFDPGEATLQPAGKRVLDAVSPTLRRLPNALTVEGHTDNVPIRGHFPSNWELSTARSTTVLRYLLAHGVQSSRVSAAGYADQRPLASNTSAQGRSRNRRVAIVVLANTVPSVPSVAAPVSGGR